ncbi:uncharacterized protein LOC143465855 [Clavelina lepadiformis]|uniref:uncharacterized protein LOC143465855 n=1 Tax=Clavelina lepadiformis TaxID=159417 RepID=UPI004043591A
MICSSLITKLGNPKHFSVIKKCCHQVSVGPSFTRPTSNYVLPTGLCTIRNLTTGSQTWSASKEMEKTDTAQEQGQEKPAEHMVGETGFWSRRVKIGTILMIGWAVLSGATMLYGSLGMREKRHQKVLEQSLDYMSDDRKAGVEKMFETKQEDDK